MEKKYFDKLVEDGFCDGCCYEDNPRPELKCKKTKCCYLVHDECIIYDML